MSADQIQTAIDQGIAFLNGFFERKNLKIIVSSGPLKTEELIFHLTGQVKELKRKPDLLSALNRLTQLAANIGRKKNIPCVLDLEGHLSVRQNLIETISADAAAVTKHTGKRAVIEGLSAYERRKVHQLLEEDEEVETLSDGEGEFRYLMVSVKR